MERTQIYLTSEQKAALEALSRMRSVPMADVVREAVSEYLARAGAEYRLKVLEETFASVPEWRAVDGVEYVRALRSGWAKREKEIRGHGSEGRSGQEAE
ncbi:MAG: ribbon-helix-helix protein, CopG family [Bacillota bacterium]|nr:ribbon-helix-helix protein, CopG family [Bacillota bacterium]